MIKNFCAKNNFSGDVPAVHRAVQSMMYDDYNLVRDIKIDEIDDFKNHPYRVVMNDDMVQLIESVKANGVLEPITIRSKENGRWELISGHRRRFAAREAGKETIPAVIVKYDDDEATIAMVDANLRREDILPSEKAFAYKMKMDAMSHQGKTSDQVGPKLTVEQISENDSASQVKRYIRLTNLIGPLLDMVDSKKISFIMGVNIRDLMLWNTH